MAEPVQMMLYPAQGGPAVSVTLPPDADALEWQCTQLLCAAIEYPSEFANHESNPGLDFVCDKDRQRKNLPVNSCILQEYGLSIQGPVLVCPSVDIEALKKEEVEGIQVTDPADPHTRKVVNTLKQLSHGFVTCERNAQDYLPNTPTRCAALLENITVARPYFKRVALRELNHYANAVSERLRLADYSADLMLLQFALGGR